MVPRGIELGEEGAGNLRSASVAVCRCCGSSSGAIPPVLKPRVSGTGAPSRVKGGGADGQDEQRRPEPVQRRRGLAGAVPLGTHLHRCVAGRRSAGPRFVDAQEELRGRRTWAELRADDGDREVG
jgi:hypothetical protein